MKKKKKKRERNTPKLFSKKENSVLDGKFLIEEKELNT